MEKKTKQADEYEALRKVIHNLYLEHEVAPEDYMEILEDARASLIASIIVSTGDEASIEVFRAVYDKINLATWNNVLDFVMDYYKNVKSK